MIEYYLGDKKCKIDFDSFLSLTHKDNKFYKSAFKNFPEFYEFIDKNKNNISHMIFDNNEYFMERGVLHNLYGAAYIRTTIKDMPVLPMGTVIEYFYIDGRLVHDHLDIRERGCKKIGDFLNKEIFVFKELTNKKSGKGSDGKYYIRKENVDYIKTVIDLDERIKFDQRSKKIKALKLREKEGSKTFLKTNKTK